MPSTTCQTNADRVPSEQRRGRRLVEKLSESALFKDYQTAFSGATGLSLTMRPVQAYEDASQDASLERNPLCELLSQTQQGCANCVKMQAALEEEANLEPKSLHCFAGLCDSAVPIRVGDELIAFLHTGQILLHQPNKEEFSKTTRQLLAWGAEVNLKAVEEAYFQTKVFDREQYDAMLRLLATFAEHLAVVSNSIEIEDQETEPKLISKAKRYIQGRYSERISLDEAAQAVNASTRHFCKVFKSATGITFTDYVARVRVEKAKHLLGNPHLRVSEIAFETGFESISQFNRSFKRITGQSPTQFRGA
jgi:AraC-like DNA-binding protein